MKSGTTKGNLHNYLKFNFLFNIVKSTILLVHNYLKYIFFNLTKCAEQGSSFKTTQLSQF